MRGQLNLLSGSTPPGLNSVIYIYDADSISGTPAPGTAGTYIFILQASVNGIYALQQFVLTFD